MTIRRSAQKYGLRRGDCGKVGEGCYYEDEITLLNSIGIQLGDRVRLGVGVWMNGASCIEIGDDSGIGPFTIIHSANHSIESGQVDWGSWRDSPVRIGRYCWVGAGCIILPGTTLGDGCIVGAGSVIGGTYGPGRTIYGQKAVAR